MTKPDTQNQTSERSEKVQEAKGTKRLSLKKNFSWTFFSNLFYAACQWLSLSVIVKLGTPADVGIFALGLAFASPAFMLSNFQLRTVVATDASNEFNFQDYLSLRLLTSVIAFCITLLIAAYFGYSGATFLAIASVCALKAAESLGDIFHGLFQAKERMDRVARSVFLKGSLGLLGTAIAFSLSGDVAIGVAGMTLGWLASFVFYDLPSARYLVSHVGAEKERVGLAFSLPTLIAIAWRSLPLGVVMFLVTLNMQVPRFFLESYHDAATLGIFVALSYFIVAGNTFVIALSKPGSTTLAHLYAAGKKEVFMKTFLKLVAIGAAIGFCGIAGAYLLGTYVLTIFYSAEYAEYNQDFVLIMLAGAIRYVAVFFGAALTACRAFKEQTMPAVIVLGISTLVFWMLVPSYGISGAAWGLAINSGVGLLSRAIVLYMVLSKFGSNIANNTTAQTKVSVAA